MTICRRMNPSVHTPTAPVHISFSLEPLQIQRIYILIRYLDYPLTPRRTLPDRLNASFIAHFAHLAFIHSCTPYSEPTYQVPNTYAPPRSHSRSPPRTLSLLSNPIPCCADEPPGLAHSTHTRSRNLPKSNPRSLSMFLTISIHMQSPLSPPLSFSFFFRYHRLGVAVARGRCVLIRLRST